ncbi:translation factor SUA5 [Granulicella rosea]|uniref:Threonylcarbamoyl-AMP synthase n=1 Tax=Granulicella rosea TaxID=474952 RepID=A0A239HRQ0_9BACT|nr:L-threonylcarbamoyladenylate synthase [Granulicella rosea]SNS83855.1 translation factor SUA5 [Granulicella rosea]
MAIARAAELLRGGGTVAFPTETVYGLGANALDRVAVAKIFAAKQRPGWDPLIVHVADAAMLARVVQGELPFRARELMEAFWPGPLTLLLPRSAAVPDAVTAGRPLVGVRMPAHPVALELIRRAGVPIAAPSANRFGHTSPTTAAHVLEDLDGRIDAVLDGGATEVGVESTVIGPWDGHVDMSGWSQDDIDFYGAPWVVYRPGGVTISMLESLGGVGFVAYTPPVQADEPESLPSPGVGIRHYAPRARVVLVHEDLKVYLPTQQVVAAIDEAFDGVATVGVMLPDGWDASCAQAVFRWGAWSDHETLARRLFAGLRELDDRGVDVIVCPVPNGAGMAAAIRDRLEKAARVK